MPAYNFQPQFAMAVVAGLVQAKAEGAPGAQVNEEYEQLINPHSAWLKAQGKRQTIRLCRKRPTHPGDTLYFYTGMRTKACVKLGEAVCKKVRPLTLLESRDAWFMVQFNGVWSPKIIDEAFAQDDGFEHPEQMRAFFLKTHGFPFHGELITW